MVTVENFIDGKFQKPLTGKYLDTFNPATGKVYGQIPDSGKDDLEQAVEAAKRAFKGWSKTPAQERSRILNKIADLIESRLQEFAEAESKDQGKPISLALSVDIPRVCSNFRFFASAILHHEERATDMDGFAMNYTVRKPAGIAGLISPWNLPLYLLTWKIAPALAVGCSVICKPSEFTSVTAWKLCSVLQEAGLPAGVCNMVFGYGHSVGKFLVQHPAIPLISFTGGTATAEHIIRESAPQYKKLYLELGGKNPNIIFDDADLTECVAATVRSSFSNQGEICLCGSRIIVQKGIYERFLEEFIAQTKKLVVGDPTNPQTNMGALVSAEHLAKVRSYVDLAKEEGGTIVYGGTTPDVGKELEGGYWLTPTIITGLSPTCRIQQEEIFGPVVGVTTFTTEEEAIEIANGVKYGLAASVWTENGKRAHRVAQAIESGTVWVNCWMVRDLRMPFGGMKHSVKTNEFFTHVQGVGRASGKDSIDFYCEQKTICMKYQ